jgi:exopolyphosphatase/guanosine-5'-triphosphate,3'-diphosphate pyrophosphatase
MLNKRRAVIDLGTNTFHLLIADVDPDGGLTEVYRERIFVKLAAEGIARIGSAPFGRGITALLHFRKKLDEYQVTDLRAIGTAALRTATNGADFVAEARARVNISIELISGTEEADYITRGVLAALPPSEENLLIMDIGGGSTEFILVESGRARWRTSFPLGISVLHRDFHHSDPISQGEINRLEQYLAKQLEPLYEALLIHPTQHLVGAAGTFEVLKEQLRDTTKPLHPTSHLLAPAGFFPLYDRIVTATLDERLAMDGLPKERADMVVVAMILLRFILEFAEIERMTVSDYALKEGVLVSQ